LNEAYTEGQLKTQTRFGFLIRSVFRENTFTNPQILKGFFVIPDQAPIINHKKVKIHHAYTCDGRSEASLYVFLHYLT